MTTFLHVTGQFASHFASQCKKQELHNNLGRDTRDDACRADSGRRAGPLRWDRTTLHAGPGRAAARLAADPPYARRACERAGSGGSSRRRLRQLPRRRHRQPGHADGARRTEGDLPFRLAGRRRRQHRRRDVSRPVALSGEFRSRAGAKDQPHAAARRPDRRRWRESTRSRPGSRRSSPMRRPASADRSTPSRS